MLMLIFLSLPPRRAPAFGCVKRTYWFHTNIMMRAKPDSVLDNGDGEDVRHLTPFFYLC